MKRVLGLVLVAAMAMFVLGCNGQMKAENEQLKMDNDQLTAQVNDLQGKLEEASRQMADLTSKRDACQTELNALKAAAPALASVLFPHPVATQKNETDVLLKYEVLNEETRVVPLEAQIKVSILVDKMINESSLKQILSKLFKTYRSKRGYQYHDRLTSIYIYAYHDRESNPAGMIGRLSWVSPGSPQIDIYDYRLRAIKEPEKNKFGLSESERRKVFRERDECELQAIKEADKYDPTFGNAHTNYYEKLMQQCYNNLNKKYRITEEQAFSISNEGIMKGW